MTAKERNKLQDLNIMINALGELSQAARSAYDAWQEIKQQQDALKADLMQMLQSSDMRSAKTAKYTASISSRPNIVVVNEQKVINWLKEAPGVEADHYLGLKKAEFKSLASSLLKETGEVIDGTDLERTESISVRSNKK